MADLRNKNININDIPGPCSHGDSVVEWLGRRLTTRGSRVRLPVMTLPGYLFFETGGRLWRVNCLGNCNHHLGQLSLASLRGR